MVVKGNRNQITIVCCENFTNKVAEIRANIH